MSAVQPKAIVIGSGLAGMSAAVRLSDAGYRVHVFEAAHTIGGRTSSWNQNGMMVESGLHRFLGFYSALPNLLEKVGINLDEMLYWEDEGEVRMPDGASAVLGVAPLHKPLETLWTVLGHNDFLTPKDKLSLAPMFTAGIKDYSLHPDELDMITVYDFAKKHHVTEQAIDRILKPFTEGVFFLPITQYSAYNFFGLFVPFLPRIAKLRVGAFMGGMSEVMMQPLMQYVLERGGQLSLGAPVDELLMQRGKIAGVRVGDDTYKADVAVLAASLQGAKRIIASSFPKDPAFKNLLALPTMPSVTFQIELTEPSMSVDRTTFGPLTSLASFAEQSRTTFRASQGRLSVILTPPETFIDMPSEEVLEVVIRDAKKLGIDIADKIKRYYKVNLPNDFYSLGVGNEKLRPLQKTHIHGFALAGDYTKQEHLATMEGAVVSGERAVEVLLAAKK